MKYKKINVSVHLPPVLTEHSSCGTGGTSGLCILKLLQDFEFPSKSLYNF